MSERLESLIPWYVSRRRSEPGDPVELGEEERRDLERLLSEDAGARQLADVARLLQEGAQHETLESIRQPVHRQLLVEYAESPETLEAPVRARIEAALAEDPIAANAVAVLRGIDPRAVVEPQEPPPAPAVPGPGARLWSVLADSVLRPLPALAYLLALVVLLPLAWRALSPPLPPAALLPSPVSLDSAVIFRGELASEPTVLVLPPGGALLLDLRLDVDAGELADPALELEVELGTESRTLYAESRAGSEIEEGRLAVVLRAPPLDTGEVYTLTVTARRGDRPQATVEIFRRSLLLAAP